MSMFHLYRVREDFHDPRYRDQFSRIPVSETREVDRYDRFGWQRICTASHREIIAFRKLLRERYGNKNPPPLEQLQFMWEVFKQEQNGRV